MTGRISLLGSRCARAWRQANLGSPAFPFAAAGRPARGRTSSLATARGSRRLPPEPRKRSQRLRRQACVPCQAKRARRSGRTHLTTNPLSGAPHRLHFPPISRGSLVDGAFAPTVARRIAGCRCRQQLRWGKTAACRTHPSVQKQLAWPRQPHRPSARRPAHDTPSLCTSGRLATERLSSFGRRTPPPLPQAANCDLLLRSYTDTVAGQRAVGFVAVANGRAESQIGPPRPELLPGRSGRVRPLPKQSPSSVRNFPPEASRRLPAESTP
jgi:hypothetical protein